VLREALRPDVNVALWRRRPAPVPPARLAPLLTGAGVAFDGVVATGAFDADRLVTPLLRPSPARDALAADLRALFDLFAAACGAPRLHAHFEALEGDGCRRFHVDYVALRLLTTYVGPGTEWLPEGALDREALTPSDLLPEVANAAIARDPRRVRRARAGDVIVLKGEAWPGNAGRGAAHRSPPVEAVRARRLVFKLTAHARDVRTAPG
jgi:hypothetical protein